MIPTLPLILGLAPIVGVTAAYLLNIDAGLLPSCMPFIEGCTSISSTGRYAPGSMVFRAILLPQAALLAVFWWMNAAWLQSLDVRASGRRIVLVSGIAGATALIIYISFLGTTQPFYEFMRRFGIYIYFLGTALSQFLLSWYLPGSKLRTAMLWVIGLPFLLGILNLAQKAVLPDPDTLENSIEWQAAILMQFWFVLLYFAWRRAGLSLSVQTDSTSARS